MNLAVPLISVVALTVPVRAATSYFIDIDSTRTSDTTTTGGSVFTNAGWTSLDVTNPVAANGASVVIDGVTFSVASADSSRIRTSAGLPNPNSLTCDFIFDDGANQAVLLIFGVAGSIQAGTWQVEAWNWDAGVPAFETNTQIAGYRTNGVETIVSSNVVPHPSNPAISFTFTSDGVSAYDFFFRDGSAGDRSRLNALSLVMIPEPCLPALLVFTALATGSFRRRRAVSTS